VRKGGVCDVGQPVVPLVGQVVVSVGGPVINIYQHIELGHVLTSWHLIPGREQDRQVIWIVIKNRWICTKKIV